MSGSYLGSSYNGNQIRDELDKVSANYKKHNTDDMLNKTIKDLLEGKIVGWFQGKMEFGPRALGNRSILADPRRLEMQKQLNLKVKYRESFRPFAPSILSEYVSEWFEHNGISPYMLFVANVKKIKRLEMTDQQKNLFGIEKLNIARSAVPAITHVDYSARIQTVHKDTNPIYHSLISQFNELTGCPIVVNTSFNIRGEPIVCTPADAFRCFMGTELDVLAIGDYLLYKTEQDPGLRDNYEEKYELD